MKQKADWGNIISDELSITEFYEWYQRAIVRSDSQRRFSSLLALAYELALRSSALMKVLKLSSPQ